MTDTEKNIKILTDLLGVKKIYYEEYDAEKRWPQFIPSGKPWRTHKIDAIPVPQFLCSMDACIKWISPKVAEWNVATDEEHKFWARVSSFIDDKTGYYMYEDYGDTPSEAFCNAVLKLIEAKK